MESHVGVVPGRELAHRVGVPLAGPPVLAGGVRAGAEPILRLTRYYDYRDAVTWRAEREWPA